MSQNEILVLLQNLEDALTRKMQQDLEFINNIFTQITMSKNNIMLNNLTDIDDNLSRIKWSDLESMLESTHPKYIIKTPDIMPNFINCSGSDGGLKIIHNVNIGAASFSLGPNSGVEGASRVMEASDSTICEVYGIYMALTTAKQLKIKHLCHCVDSQTALSIVSKAIQFKTSQCQSLSNYLETYPYLGQIFCDLFNLSGSFEYLALIWTRGHSDTNLTNIFSSLNTQSDNLCSTLISQQERLLNRANH